MIRMKTQTDDITPYIVKRYGGKELYLYLALYKAGIPERFWQANVDSPLVQKAVSTLTVSKYNRMIVQSFDIEDTIAHCATVAKALQNSAFRKTRWMLHFDLITALEDKFGRADKLLQPIKNTDVLIVPNIIFGKLYHDTHDAFTTLLSHIFGGSECKIILGIKSVPNGEDFSRYYGHLLEFFPQAKTLHQNIDSSTIVRKSAHHGRK